MIFFIINFFITYSIFDLISVFFILFPVTYYDDDDDDKIKLIKKKEYDDDIHLIFIIKIINLNIELYEVFNSHYKSVFIITYYFIEYLIIIF